MYLAQCNFYAAHIFTHKKCTNAQIHLVTSLYLVYMRTMQSQTGPVTGLMCVAAAAALQFFTFALYALSACIEAHEGIEATEASTETCTYWDSDYCFKDQCALKLLHRHSVAFNGK